MQFPQDQFSQLLTWLKKTPRWVWGVILLVLIVGVALLINPEQEVQPGQILTSTDENPTFLAVDVFLKFAVVLGLIYLGFYLLHRWQIQKPGGRKKQLAVVDTLFLNPRRAIYLIQAGERRLVIGATDQSISLLTELLPDEEIGGPAVTPLTSDENFANLLNDKMKS